MDISGLMQPDLQAVTEWCDGVERVLEVCFSLHSLPYLF